MFRIGLVIILLLALSCGVREVEVVQNPFSGEADYQWNQEVLLTGNEQESVYMYGIQISIPDYEFSFCSGYGANICLDKSILEYFKGEKK